MESEETYGNPAGKARKLKEPENKPIKCQGKQETLSKNKNYETEKT